jgi:DNA modification methylase
MEEKAKKINREFIKVSLDKLKPHPKNPKKHDDKFIKNKIKKLGYASIVTIDENNTILAGHGRIKALKDLGYKEIEVLQVKGWTEKEKEEYLLSDNQATLLEGLDDDLLKQFDKEILDACKLDSDILIEPEEKDDEVPEIPKEPKSKLGEIYQLGKHKIMCGDSTKIEDVEKLMEGKKADMVFTDPPYGINEKGDRRKRKGKNSLMGGQYYDSFIDDSIEYAVKAYNICEELKILRQVWWGANYYCHHLPQRNNWFVWDKRVDEKQKNTDSDCELAWVKSKFNGIRIFRHLWKGLMKDSEKGQKRVHPTQKPVELAVWSFKYYNNVKTVLDLFLGSGSTLIACEKTNRICYGMELDPKYIDVIIKRYEDYTGNKAKLIQ